MKDDKIYLLHIRDAISRLIDYTSEGYDFFLEDIKTQDAVLKNLEVIGEATKKISEKFRQENQNIPWKSMSGMRDKLVHDYFGVNLDIIWETIEKNIPKLKEKIETILKKL